VFLLKYLVSRKYLSNINKARTSSHQTNKERTMPIDKTTIQLLRQLRNVSWTYTQGPLADAVRDWQDEGCPDAPLDAPDDWENAGTIAMDLLAKLEGNRADIHGSESPIKSPEDFNAAVARLRRRAIQSVRPNQVLDSLLRHAATVAIMEVAGSNDHPARHLVPKSAVATLQAYLQLIPNVHSSDR
jgi:hypothetical protein